MTCNCPYCGAETEIPPLKLIQPENLLMWPEGFLSLTPTEAVIISQLMKAYPRARKIDDIIMANAHNWQDINDPPMDDSLRVQICHLRKKLVKANAPLSIPHTGYGCYALVHRGAKNIMPRKPHKNDKITKQIA